MRTQLYAHNKTAYQKVMKAFDTSDRTCVVHPTGTGKSYLIAAVSENYQKVLILGPNIFVLDQVYDVLRWRKRGVEYMTYQTLNLTENPHADYDLICLDEFHRAGAPEWGAAVDRLLDLNTHAKVLGTTATHIRYLDNERNMADELFHGNIASHITIAETWNRSILPIPRYVSGLFRWDKTIGKAKDRIERNRSLSAEEKRQRIFRLNNARLHWELSYGMPAVLKKHLDRDARRVIIFCAHIESLKQMQQEVVGWFIEAGFTIASTCIMHSKLTNGEQRRQMRQFEDDTDRGLKLMFSVDMLNEGVHIPNVNAVLMLRTTSSRIIYLQQMGRCLTAANTEKPLVLDMVDNITTTTAVKILQEEFDALEIPMAEHEGREPRKFQVTDYTLSIKQLVDKLAPALHTYLPFEECLDAVTEFCEEHGRFPGKKDDKDMRLTFSKLMNYKDRPEVISLIEKYGRKVVSQETKIQMMQEFTAKHGRKPLYKESEMYRIWSCMIGEDKGDPRVKAMRDKYCEVKMTQEERVAVMQEFCRKHGRKPKPSEKEMYDIWHYMIDAGKTDERVIALREQYGPKYKNWDDKIRMMEDFTQQHGRRPNKFEKESYAIWRGMVWYRKNDPRVIELREKYAKTISLDEKICMMQEFTAKHGRKPSPKENEMHLIWAMMVQQVKKDQRIKVLCDKYGKKVISQEEKIQIMQKFTQQHGRKPMKEEKEMYGLWATMLSLGKSDPRVLEMKEKYGKIKQNKE